MSIASLTTARHPRIAALDILRGLALLGMFVFHTTWDLAYFQLVPPTAPFSPAFVIFGHTIASTFLALVGASLVLALPDGRPGRAYWRRLALIGGSAMAITVATYAIFPDAFIFFGILHCIAAASLLALPFLRLPAWAALAAGLVCIILPLIAATPALNGPAWWWLGLGTVEPRTNDWRPMLPWSGVVLLGLAGMRLAVASGWSRKAALWSPRAIPARALIWGGRHSLIIYILHQPLFFGMVWALAQIAGPPAAPPLPDPADVPFLSNCASQCVAAGAEAGLCGDVCGCIGGAIRRQPAIWQRLVSDALSPADRDAIDVFTRQCVAQRSQ